MVQRKRNTKKGRSEHLQNFRFRHGALRYRVRVMTVIAPSHCYDDDKNTTSISDPCLA